MYFTITEKGGVSVEANRPEAKLSSECSSFSAISFWISYSWCLYILY